MIKQIKTPMERAFARELKAGEMVSLSGTIYGARDSVHKGLINMLDRERSLPFDIRNQIIYYLGPCPARPGEVIGSAGPTTSGRMDVYTPRLIEMGLTGMIGKGSRSAEVISAMIRYGAVYFGAIGGAGALISKSIISEEIIAFRELGPEALRKLEVKDFIVTVINDSHGGNLYVSGRDRYRRP